MKTMILACNIFKYELTKSMEETDCNYPIQWVDTDSTEADVIGLHQEPEKLKLHLHELVNKIENIDQLLLCFGFCGNALLGLKPPSFRLIFPKADDCITLFLGSIKKRKEVTKEMGTYFFTKSWVEFKSQIWNGYKAFCESLSKRIGMKRAEELFFKTMLPPQFKRLGVVDTGAYDLEEIMDKTKAMAQGLKLCHEIIPGTMGFIKKLITGPWDEDFIIINAGETVTLNHIVSDAVRQ